MRRAKILVVENDPALAADLTRTLEGMGYEASAITASESDVMAAVRNHDPDLAFVDIRIGGPPDGAEMARRIMEEFKAPVVFLTDSDDETSARRATEGARRAAEGAHRGMRGGDLEDPPGPLDYVLVPFDFRDIRTAVDIAMHRQALEGALRRSEERYAKIFQASPVSILVTSLTTDRILEVNEAFLHLSGWEASETEGRTLEEIGWWAFPEERERLLSAVREHGSAHDLEMSYKTRFGDVRQALVSAELLEIEGEERLLTLVHDISGRKALERKLERLALHDSLTGLPNQTLFRDRLAHAFERVGRERTRIGVILMDLDRFKLVNDALGHAAGDQLLEQVVSRVQGCFRDDDTFARFGGDEFAVVMERVEGKEDVLAVAERITLALEAPFEVEGTEVRLSASIGAAIGCPETTTQEDLLRFADVAMYRAKNTRGMSYRVFDPLHDTRATERLHRENELWSALDRDELIVLYQPIVSLSTEQIIGCEALVRWEHPERGLISPSEFIGMAEDSGLIVPIGEQVVRRACDDVHDWLGSTDGRFLLSVNLSSRQFDELELLESIDRALLGTGIRPSDLQLEITESVVVRSPSRVVQLRDYGVRIAIDDFGTGYSSLRYLMDLEVDTLKIDPSFTRGVGRSRKVEHILRTLVHFSHGLGINVVAEGIETAEQHRFFRGIGCDLGQGYLYSTPLPSPLFKLLLSGSPPKGNPSTLNGPDARGAKDSVRRTRVP